jgi:uncharacterized membrane protein
MFDIYHPHPMIVHFPIALIMVGFLADFLSLIIKKEICLSRIGLYLEVLGAISVIVAVGTGYFLTGDTLEGAGHTGQMHEIFAFLTLGSIIVAAGLRLFLVIKSKEETNLKYLAMGIFFIAFVFVAITGYFGGMIVYGNA